MRAKMDYSHGKCRLLTRARLDANRIILFASSLARVSSLHFP